MFISSFRFALFHPSHPTTPQPTVVHGDPCRLDHRRSHEYRLSFKYFSGSSGRLDSVLAMSILTPAMSFIKIAVLFLLSSPLSQSSITVRLTPSPTLSDLYGDRCLPWSDDELSSSNLEACLRCSASETGLLFLLFRASAPSAPKLKFFLSRSCFGISCHSVSVSDGSYPLCPSLAVNLVSSSYPTILRTIDLCPRSLLILHRSHRNAKAVADMQQRNLQTSMEQEESRIAETADIQIKQCAAGNESNMRALLSTLQYVLWTECGWQPVSLTDMITSASVKKVYRKATLCIHPDKVQQKGASLEQSHLRMPSID
ncbi:auxilin-related protein 1 [Senna tora]|uniref:Auxilin-related protein 1 n=1 Tax=Senna tora TaxID=362788 RepID=A0A834W7P2_9FABA|nr:auxilin-related protein 1 [Senna tora]